MGYGSSRGHKLAVIVGPDEEAKQVFNLRNLATRQEDKGLAWSVLEDSVQSLLEIIKQEEARPMTAPAAQPPRQDEAADPESPVGLVRGTRDWLPADCAAWRALERQLLDGFARAGYEPIRTPILEFTELHERKSGAGIVSKLFELTSGGTGAICLRPELTASIVRAFTEAERLPSPPLASQQLRPGLPLRNRHRLGAAARVHPGRRRALGRRRPDSRRRGDRTRRPVALGRRLGRRNRPDRPRRPDPRGPGAHGPARRRQVCLGRDAERRRRRRRGHPGARLGPRAIDRLAHDPAAKPT